MKTLVFCALLVGTLAVPHRKPMFRRGLNRIVGGTEALPGELPYQLSFQDTSYLIPFHFCGASIKDENTAICAAHCVAGEDLDNPNYLQVVAGEHDRAADEGTEQKIILSKIVKHENYNPFTVNNDISLLKLSQPFVWSDYVQPIDLPAAGHAASGYCTVSGWGTTTEGGNTPTVLMKVDVPIVSDADCRAAYGESDIADSMICAGESDGGKDSCQGDSGGPLACSDTGSPYLAGIVSWGYGCARPDYPGVYTEVSYFIDWIQANA